MFDNSSNMDAKDDEVSVPGLLASMASTGQNLKEYAVRIDRFEIGGEGDGTSGLESLYTRGLDGTNNLVILKEKSFTDNEILVVVVFYMEKKLVEDPASVLAKLQKSEED